MRHRVRREGHVETRLHEIVSARRWRNHVEDPRDQLVVPVARRQLEREELLERVAPHQRRGRGGGGAPTADASAGAGGGGKPWGGRDPGGTRSTRRPPSRA